MTRVAWNGEPEWRTEVCELQLARRRAGRHRRPARARRRPPTARPTSSRRAATGSTRRLRVEVGGVGSLELRHDGKGTWAGVENAAELEGALDCDLAFSPLTNLMPVRRHRLHEQPGTVDFAMAWVSLPDLKVHRSAAALRAPRARPRALQLRRLRGRPRARRRRPRGRVSRACAAGLRVDRPHADRPKPDHRLGARPRSHRDRRPAGQGPRRRRAGDQRFGDADEPVRGVLDSLEERLAWGADEDPPIVMAQALVLYLGHRLERDRRRRGGPAAPRRPRRVRRATRPSGSPPGSASEGWS